MITDEMLKIAAAEADQAILHSLPQPDECDHSFSPRFERSMRGILRRMRHPAAYRFLSRAACFLVAVLLVGASWLAVDVEARADFVVWVRQQYESMVEYRFTGSAPEGAALHYAPTWLPDGYEEIKADSAGGTAMRLYSNPDGRMIYFLSSSGADATSLFLVSDTATVEKVLVGTQEADFYQEADPERANALVWQSETGEVLFSLSAALPKDDLIKIAASITLID